MHKTFNPRDFRLAGLDEKATHARCKSENCTRGGYVVAIDADDHSCRWVMLVRKDASNEHDTRTLRQDL